MEQTVARYQRCIKQFLSEYEQLVTEHSKVVLLFDDKRMQYMAVRMGWLHQKRLHFCLLHIEISGETVIIQCNNTEDSVATELAELGIAPENIRLGFLPSEYQTFARLATDQRKLELA